MTELQVSRYRVRQACDQCFKAKLKCDSSLPKCATCFNRKSNCTRLRKIKKVPKMADNESFHSQHLLLSISTTSSKENKRGKSKQLVSHNIILNRDILHTNAKLTNLLTFAKASCKRVDTSISFFSIFPTKLFHSPFLMDSTSYLIYQINPNVSMNQFFEQTRISSHTIVELSIRDFNDSFLRCYYQQAFLAYFRYVNSIFPLFSIKQFYAKKRSIYLISAITLVGLTLLKQDGYIDHICLKLKSLLISYLTPSKIPASLDDVQCMAVLMNGLNGTKYSLPSYTFTSLIRGCFSLGLHLKSPKSKFENSDIGERKLCFAAALYLDSFTNPYFYREYGYIGLWDSNKLDKKSGLNNDYLMNLKDPFLEAFLAFFEYLYHVTISWIRLYDLLLYPLPLKISNKDALVVTSWCKKILKLSRGNAMAKFNALNGNLSSSNILFIQIRNLVNAIDITYHSFNITLYDLDCIALENDPHELFTFKPLKNIPKGKRILYEHFNLLFEANQKLGFKHCSAYRFYPYLSAERSLLTYKDYLPDFNKLHQTAGRQFRSLYSRSLSEQFRAAMNQLIFRTNSEATHSN